MNNVEYRAASIENDPGFVYGYYCPMVYGKFPPIPSIVISNYSIVKPIRIDINTLGMFSGIFDINDNKIYKGDILIDTLTQSTWIVEYGFCKKCGFTGWYLKGQNVDMERPLNNNSDTDTPDYKIIGNIYNI